MSQTLYRKYRSQTFAELVGQESVTRILRNAIRRSRLSHAYLFCGPRGTGKTSVARIFAKALCCLDPQDGDCCGKCENCVAIATGNAVDVIEIDAASRNKVEDIRDLREKVGYAPINYPFKIYIIDEVHMVTAAGFNALLKTLEEPPAHVKFLFATTEPHKLPITILSRCIRFDFQRIPLDELAKHLVWIAAEEGFRMDEEAGLLLSRLAEGSARDAISLLDQLTVYCSEEIRVEDAQQLFQLGDPELPGRVLQMLRSDDRSGLLEVWNGLVEQGADAGRFLVRVSEAIKHDYIANPDPRTREALTVMWEALNLLKFESFPALLVELSLLRCHELMSSSGLSDGSYVAAASRPETIRETQAAPRPEPERPVAEPHPREKPAPEPFEQHGDDKWAALLADLERNSLTTYALVRLGVKPSFGDGLLMLEFEDNGPGRTALRYTLQEEHSRILRSAAASSYGSPCAVHVKVLGESGSAELPGGGNEAPAPAPGSATIEPPDVQQDKVDSGKGGNVSAEDAMELFGATDVTDGD